MTFPPLGSKHHLRNCSFVVAVPILAQMVEWSGASVSGMTWICWRRPFPGAHEPSKEGRWVAVPNGNREMRISSSLEKISDQLCLRNC